MNKQPIKEGSLRKQADLIRRAYRAGRKTVTIENIKFKIRRFDRKDVLHETGGETNKRTHTKVDETWLLAVPADGSLVPRFCVEMTPGKNGVMQHRK